MINLEEKYIHFIQSVLKKYAPNNTVWLFGSRTTEKIKPYSDIDLVIMSKKPVPMSTLSKLTHAFSDSDLPYKVDIVDWSSLDADFQKIIQSRYEIIQESD